MRILFLSSWKPYPPDNGAKIRTYNLLRGLAQGHVVDLIIHAEEIDAQTPSELRRLCRHIDAVRRPAYDPRSIRSTLGILARKPRSLFSTYKPEMKRLLRTVLDERSHDLVIASQWATAAYWQMDASPPAIFEEVELGVLLSKRKQALNLAEKVRHSLPLLKLSKYVRQTLPRFRACTVASDEEARILDEIAPDYANISVIPNFLDFESYANCANSSPNGAKQMIFAGSLSYFANHDAMLWFLSDIFELIQQREPEAKLCITGKVGDARLPPRKGVELRGFVQDVRPVVASAGLCIAPIRLGGGTRLKILEAMALGVPVVSTSLGAEGLGAKHEEHLLIGDTPAEFAHGVIRLLNDLPLRKRLIDNASQLVRERYDAKVVIPQFLELVERAAAS